MLGYIVIVQCFMYPVIMSWIWNVQDGYLRGQGYFDRGGSVVIFQTGALGGLIGAIVLGPRYGRFMPKGDEQRITACTATKTKTLATMLTDVAEDNADVDDLFLRKIRKLVKKAGSDNDFNEIDNGMMAIGTVITVIGWAMLNSCGSGTHNINTVAGRYEAELAFMNTFIAGSFSSIIAFICKRHVVREHQKIQKYDIKSLCNGFLAGIAAVSSGSGTMKPWGALATGVIEGFLYVIICFIWKKVKFDDPMENFQIYGSGAFFSTLASSFLIPNKGILWGGQDSGSLLGNQLLGWTAVSIWTMIVSWIYFYVFKRCKLLKLKKAEEVVGIDTITEAREKGIDITQLLDTINKMYPDSRKKGC